MKVLILGAGGMAGHVLSVFFQERGHEAIGFARRALPWCETILGDALSRSALRLAIAEGAYDAVINCAGVLNQAVDHSPADGIFINSCLPHYLAEWTKEEKTKIVHVSTDCVFSGLDHGGYREDSFCSADTLYGRSKALGEIKDNKNLTLRTSLVGPDVNPEGKGLFHWFMGQHDAVNGFSSFRWTGVTTITLARAAEAAILQNLTGVYHLVNNQVITKCELLQMFNAIRRRPIVIRSQDGALVDKSLRNGRRDFAFSVPSYHDMMEEMRRWIADHSHLYPRYDVRED